MIAVGPLAAVALELSPIWYSGGGGRSKVSVMGDTGVVNLARFLSGKSELGVGIVVGVADGVGNVGTMEILGVGVTRRTLFLSPMTVLRRGKHKSRFWETEVVGDDGSEGALVTAGGAIGEIWGVGATSSSSKGSVSSPDAKSGEMHAG